MGRSEDGDVARRAGAAVTGDQIPITISGGADGILTGNGALTMTIANGAQPTDGDASAPLPNSDPGTDPNDDGGTNANTNSGANGDADAGTDPNADGGAPPLPPPAAINVSATGDGTFAFPAVGFGTARTWTVTVGAMPGVNVKAVSLVIGY